MCHPFEGGPRAAATVPAHQGIRRASGSGLLRQFLRIRAAPWLVFTVRAQKRAIVRVAADAPFIQAIFGVRPWRVFCRRPCTNRQQIGADARWQHQARCTRHKVHRKFRCVVSGVSSLMLPTSLPIVKSFETICPVQHREPPVRWIQDAAGAHSTRRANQDARSVFSRGFPGLLAVPHAPIDRGRCEAGPEHVSGHVSNPNRQDRAHQRAALDFCPVLFYVLASALTRTHTRTPSASACLFPLRSSSHLLAGTDSCSRWCPWIHH